MNATEIHRFILDEPVLRHAGVTVCCYDQVRNNGVYVVNTLHSKSTKRVGHWVAYIKTDSDTFLFDSLGKKAFGKLPYTVCNERAVQHPLSTTCGHFCLFYLCFKIRGAAHDAIMSLFCDSYEKNELLVAHTLLQIK